MIQKLTASAVPGLALLALLVTPAQGQLTTRVSVGSGGTQSNEDSYSPALSGNGRFVVFYSEASNLVPGDTNDAEDIFLRDRRADTTVRISVDENGIEANGDCYSPAITLDGRFVVYYSAASNLVPNDTNDTDDVFVYDVASGLTERISVDSNGVQGNGRSLYGAISADGRLVVFHSYADNLVPGDTNGDSDVFLHDRATGLTTLVSVDSAGIQGDRASSYATISADGTRIAFQSRARNLVPGDLNKAEDVFLRDLEQGTTTCVSVDANGAPGDRGSYYSCISGDGRSVAFASQSTNLVPVDTNGLTDAFVRDLELGRTVLISVSTRGVQGNAISQIHTLAALSYDGRLVAFKSEADNLVPGDTNGTQDIFLWDRLHRTTTRMSVGLGGAEAQDRSSQPAISSDGHHVAFYSFAANLVRGDTNAVPDAFVRSVH